MDRIRSRLRHERGSLPLTLLAVMVIAGVVTVLVGATFQGQRAARFDRDFTTVIQSADAGAQQAVYRITHQDLDPTTSHSGSGSLGDASFAWTATPVSPVEWRVQSTGTRNGVDRVVVATVRDEPRFGFAVFADRAITFRGANSADSYGQTWYTGNGVIGTNETVRLDGNASVNGVHLYDWDANPDLDRCSGNGCADVRAQPSARSPSARIGPRLRVGTDLDTAFIDEQLATCEAADGPLESWTTSADGGVLTGPPAHPSVLCLDSLTIDTNTTVSGPLRVYVRNGISIANHRSVNCADGCVAGSSRPEAARLQLYNAAGDVAIGVHVSLAAAVYAPRSKCGGNPSNAQAEVFGSLICAVVENQGGWRIHYDDRLQTEGSGHLRVTSWREE
jgi:type II secretory pathway pseudopilin PulG